MQCPVSDKETINGVALAKGIKSTHAWLLFKLIKGSFFLGGQVYLYNKERKKQETAQAILLSWQIFSIRWSEMDNNG